MSNAIATQIQTEFNENGLHAATALVLEHGKFSLNAVNDSKVAKTVGSHAHSLHEIMGLLKKGDLTQAGELFAKLVRSTNGGSTLAPYKLTAFGDYADDLLKAARRYASCNFTAHDEHSFKKGLDRILN